MITLVRYLYAGIYLLGGSNRCLFSGKDFVFERRMDNRLPADREKRQAGLYRQYVLGVPELHDGEERHLREVRHVWCDEWVQLSGLVELCRADKAQP